MKKVLVSVVMFMALGAGCATSEEAQQPSDSLDQVEQEVGGPCRENSWCPLGERCDFSQPYGTMWTCVAYAVVGPWPHPCVDTAQCRAQWWSDSTCVFQPGMSYGSCVRP